MSATYSIEVPGIPKSLNRVGSRGSAFAFYREKKLWQDQLTIALRYAKVPTGLTFVEATATLHPATNRRRDEGNFRAILEKSLGDALVRGGWTPDDTPEHFTFGRLTFGAKREHPLTVVELAVVSAGERAA